MSERVWSRVEKAGTDECWLWMGRQRTKRRDDGSYESPYGRLGVRYGPRKEGRMKDHYAHRVAYELMNGPTPKGMMVRHLCHNTLCCNPKHLELGTNGQNMKDMVEAGRSLRGSKNPRAKLNEGKIVKIRHLRNQGWTLKRIAEKYQVHLATIGLICSRKTWQ